MSPSASNLPTANFVAPWLCDWAPYMLLWPNCRQIRYSDDSMLSLFEIPEYHRLISHAGFNRNSGAGIYAHKLLRYQVGEFHESLPAVAVKQTNAPKNCFTVACVYNSPSCDKLRSIHKLSTWTSALANSKHPCYIVGDMNINLLGTKTTSNNYIKSMPLRGFTQPLANQPVLLRYRKLF